MAENYTHFKPESLYSPTSPESRELSEKKEMEFVVDPSSGEIVKIGDPRDVREWLEAQKQKDPSLIISVSEGGVALPGFTDSHHHLLYATLDVIEAGWVGGAESSEAIKRNIEEGIKDTDKMIPKVFLGHNTASVPEIWKKDLDQISPQKPIALVDASFHGSRLNSSMLKLLAEVIEKEKEAGRRIAGSLDAKTGQATEGYAILAIQVAESYYGIDKISEKMVEKLDSWIGQGITDIHEMFPMSWDDFVATLMTKKSWEKESGARFPVRQIFMTPDLINQLMEKQKELQDSGLFDPNRDWQLMGMKLVADGSFGSHTAMIKEPYATTGGKGVEFNSLKELNKAIRMARDIGLEKIAMHAIGDAGVGRAIETAKEWRKIAEQGKVDSSRFRIEHFELPGQKNIETAGEMGLWVSSQPNFLTDFVYKDRLSGRVTQICPHAEMLQKGVQMHFGSDGMPTSALFGIWAATHHPNPNQRISFEQALAAYSLTAADYERDPKRGRIAEGASADIVVLNKQTVGAMLEGAGTAEELAEMGGESKVLESKVSELEAGIAKIYRQGRLVKK